MDIEPDDRIDLSQEVLSGVSRAPERGQSSADDVPVGAPGEDDARCRLSVLLFVLREKLDQRHRLRHKADVMLVLLGVCALVGAVAMPCYLWLTGLKDSAGVPRYQNFWTHLYFVILALWPFGLSVLNYFWTTFAQIFLRGMPTVEAMMDLPQFRPFARDIDLDLLTDDWSVLSLLGNLFAVDVGFGMARFFVLAGIMIAPAAIQAWLSVAVVMRMQARAAVEYQILSAGMGALYLVFFLFTVLKDVTLYSCLRRAGE